MKMKKLFSILLSVVMIFLLCSCGTKNDEAFLKNMQKGLEKRWSAPDSQQNYSSNSAYKDYLRKLINYEIDAIGNIEEYSFEDKELESLARQYVDALNSQLDGVSYYGSDDGMYLELFEQNGYNNRALVIYNLVENYNLSVSPKCQAGMDDLYAAGRLRYEENKMIQQMQEIIKAGVTLESLGGTNYQIVIKNTTDYDLSSTNLNFNLYDDEGVMQSTSAYIDSWPSGSTNKVQVFSQVDFSKVEMQIEYYSQKIYNYISTDYYPIEYVNNMIVEISLKTNLPNTFYYKSNSGKTYTECEVDDFTYETKYWNEGKATVDFNISGTKIFDMKGDSYSRGGRIGWKLYDEKNNIVDSGNFITNNICVGEKYINCTESAHNIEPGKYYLELLNVA